MQWEKYIDNIRFVRHEYRTLKLSVFEFSVLKLLNGSWRIKIVFVCVCCVWGYIHHDTSEENNNILITDFANTPFLRDT